MGWLADDWPGHANRTSSGGRDLTITITYFRYSDDMSGESSESTVEVLFDGTALRGCGQALH